MRRRLGLLVMAACLAAACGSSGNVEKERQNLLSIDREWSQQGRDMERFLARWAPEGSLYLPGLPIATGQTNIRNATNQFAAAPGFSMRWAPTKSDVSSAGDLGYTSGAYQITRNDSSGKTARENGKYVTAWKKDPAGQWRVVEFIFNPDAVRPPPPPPPAEPAAAPKKK